MAKPKYSTALKIEIAKSYLNGDGSYASLALKYNVGHKSVEDWVKRYREHGELGFLEKVSNSTYTSEFKEQCVVAVLNGDGSVDDIVAKYNISSRSVLLNWIKMYNANRKLEDYIPNKEVYMAEARRKTTIEERKEIVDYCVNHNRDYKGTASIYDVSYSQIYSWVRKYDMQGEDGLTDKRGRHKTDDEVDELERLRRENARLKRQLQEKDMLAELLKKVQEFEGM
jgi:transposase-like protein